MIDTEGYEEQELEVWLSDPQTDVLNARTALILDLAGQGAGKTENIGFSSGFKITEFPQARGFIASNTIMQLNQSTLNKAFSVWKTYFNLTEYDAKSNPDGDYVLDKQPPFHFYKYERLKNYHGTISFKNGCLIYTGSLENYKAHDGKEFAWAELDETKDTKKEALTMVIFARLRQYGLWVDTEGEVYWDNKITIDEAAANNWSSWNPCTIHTSPAEGGVDWLIEMFDLDKYEEEISAALADKYTYFYRQTSQQTIVIYQTYWNEANLPPGYIESRKAQLSESEQLKFIDGYPFSKNGGEYFPNFNRKTHVEPVTHVPGTAHHMMYDFNIMPYLTQLAGDVNYVQRFWHEKEKRKCYVWEEGCIPMQVLRIGIYKEYPMKSPFNSTEQAADAFINDIEPDTYPDVFIYGDASGRNRITGMGDLTQYRILEGKLRRYLPNNWNRVPKANVAILKRRDLMNRIFEGKIPEVEFVIDPSCTETIRDFEFLKLDPTGKGKFEEKVKDPNTGKEYVKLGHISDAVEYFICILCKQYLRVF